MIDRLARNLVDVALEFQARRPWASVPEDAPFLLRLPGEPLPLAGTIIGQAGRDFGLVLMRGEHAFARFAEMIQCPDDRPRGSESWDLVTISFDALGNLAPELRRILEEAGHSARREQSVPLLAIKRPHRQVRAPNRGEMRLMIASLRGVLRALETGLDLWTLTPEREEVLELTILGEGKELGVARAVVPWPERIVIPDAVLDLGPGLGGLPQSEARWFAELLTLPGAVQGDDRSLRLFALAELEGEQFLAHEVVPGDELGPVAAKLAAVLRGEAGIPAGRPRAITFGSAELHDALAPALAGLGIETRMGEPPEFVHGFQEHILDAAAARVEPERIGGLPQDLDGWRKVDRGLTERLLLAAAESPRKRALARYFGSETAAAQVLTKLERLSPFVTFMEWFLFDYRSTKRAQTLAEKFAEQEPLTAAEQHVLQVRLAAPLSIFRIDALHRSVSLEVVDVFTGARHVIQDRALSDSIEEHHFLPLRLVQLGEWTLTLLAGPPLGAAMVDEAMALFARHGAPAEGQSLRPHAALFGSLWTLLLARSEAPPRIQNTDGEPLELVTAVFRVGDPAALRRALEERDDVDACEDGTWNWIRPTPPVPGMGQITLLARMSLDQDRLAVELNSAPRLERLRAWLERIPGIRFERSETRAPDLTGPSAPRPRKPERSLPSGLRAQIEAHLVARYRSWLDEPVPALGGLTPRKAVLVPAGRRRVFELIQTMPAAAIPGGSIQPPREMLLRELGLQAHS